MWFLLHPFDSLDSKFHSRGHSTSLIFKFSVCLLLVFAVDLLSGKMGFSFTYFLFIFTFRSAHSQCLGWPFCRNCRSLSVTSKS